MSTENTNIVLPFARMSWMLPWLIAVATSVAVAWAMTAVLLGTQPNTLPAASTPTTTETFGIGRACDAADNWQLVYARTTGRLPANFCPAAR